MLFVDEFDLLHSEAAPEAVTSVLGTLRWARQNQHAHNMRAFIGVNGAFSILDLVGVSGSPFNARSSAESPPFTYEQTRDLLHRQWVGERSGRIDPDQVLRIVDDVDMRTEGHAGCVDFCGKQLDEVLLRQGQRASRTRTGYAMPPTWMSSPPAGLRC